MTEFGFHSGFGPTRDTRNMRELNEKWFLFVLKAERVAEKKNEPKEMAEILIAAYVMIVAVAMHLPADTTEPLTGKIELILFWHLLTRCRWNRLAIFSNRRITRITKGKTKICIMNSNGFAWNSIKCRDSWIYDALSTCSRYFRKVKEEERGSAADEIKINMRFFFLVHVQWLASWKCFVSHNSTPNIVFSSQRRESISQLAKLVIV